MFFFETASCFEELRRKVRVEENEMMIAKETLEKDKEEEKVSVNQHP